MSQNTLQCLMFFIGGGACACLSASLLVESDGLRLAGFVAGLPFLVYLIRTNFNGTPARRVKKDLR